MIPTARTATSTSSSMPMAAWKRSSSATLASLSGAGGREHPRRRRRRAGDPREPGRRQPPDGRRRGALLLRRDRSPVNEAAAQPSARTDRESSSFVAARSRRAGGAGGASCSGTPAAAKRQSRRGISTMQLACRLPAARDTQRFDPAAGQIGRCDERDRISVARRRRVAVGHGDGRRRRQHRGDPRDPRRAGARGHAGRWRPAAPTVPPRRRAGPVSARRSPASRSAGLSASSCFPSRATCAWCRAGSPAARGCDLLLQLAASPRSQLTATAPERSARAEARPWYPGTAARRTPWPPTTAGARSGDPGCASAGLSIF